jgi:alpha-N-arabinofuranosidase
MANLAQTINVLQAVLLTDEEKMILTPTYHVMKMYNVHQDAQLLPLTLSNVDYELDGKKLPAISASASKDKEDNIHISLVNIDAKNTRTVSLTVRGTDKGAVSGTILQAANLSDHNTFDNPDKIAPKTFRGFQKSGDQLTVTLPPFSVVVLAVE